MKDTLHKNALDTIRHHRMIAAGDRIGVAVSGGADSVALLHLLQEFRAELGISLCVLHLNHTLRGAESDSDEAFVAKMATQAGLPLLNEREDVAALARRRHWNLEDAGRRARYAFFDRAIAAGHCTKIAVAHTADDQAETVLGRLLRGAGPRGLIGIHFVRGNVIRPLLEVRREDLREYLKSRSQPWREDASNLDATRQRARLRHHLLPQLQREFNPAIVERLASLAEIFRDEEAFWQLATQSRLNESATTAGSGANPEGGQNIVVSLSIPDLFRLPADLENAALSASSKNPNLLEAARLAMARRVTLAALRRATHESAAFDAQHVTQVIRLAQESQSGRRLELPHGVRVERIFDRIEFRPAATQPTEPSAPEAHLYEYPFAFSREGLTAVDVPELGLRFSLKPIDWPQTQRDTNHQAGVLDAELLAAPLILRNWRPGDALQLPGKRQPRKLKQLLADGRIDARKRPGWPVLTSAGRIAWTRGWVAAGFSAGKSTRNGIVVLEEKL
jgi:tRNA(Ile)-lysidine synthase